MNQSGLPLVLSIAASSLVIITAIPPVSVAQPRSEQNPLLIDADRNAPKPGVSPARRINRRASTVEESAPLGEGFRSFDGRGNNLSNPDIGGTHTPLLRLVPADYSDSVEAMAGVNRPSPRAISQAVSDQHESISKSS